MIDEELDRLIGAIFRTGDAARAVFGEGPAAFPASWRDSNVSTAINFDERIRMLDREYRDHIDLLGRQLAELGDDERLRVEAEVMSLLICVRELQRHFPEVLVGHGASRDIREH